MKKSLLKGVAAILVAAVMLTGCGGNSPAGDGTDGSSTEAAAVDNGTEETKHIIVTYVTAGTTPTDMQMVQDAVNDITIPDIGVEVEFMPIALNSTFTNYTTSIAGGERMDLMLTLWQDAASYYRNGSILPLDDLLAENAPALSSLSEEFPILAEANGEVYAVAPLDPSYGTQPAVLMKSDYLEGIEIKDMYSQDDLTELFAMIKEAHPELYPFGAVGNSVTSTSTIYAFVGGTPIDVLGASIRSGVLLSTDSTEIVNLFESDEYYNFLKLMKKWYDLGYIMTDAATTDSTIFELISSGVVGSQPNSYNPVVLASAEQSFGDLEVLKTADIYYAATNPSSICWMVPVTSGEPEAAVKFLDYLYSNSQLQNLIQWGIEGIHWEKTDTEGVIQFANGYTADTTPYYTQFGVWGDRRGEYSLSPEVNRESNDAFTAAAMKNSTKAVGYVYDSTNMQNQIMQIDAVLTKYMPTLETGGVSDLEGTYEKFIAELKTAGIDEVIADNQAQFDKWLSQQ